jgi:glycogen operon protein
VRLNGDAIDELNERGERIVGETLLLLLNGGADPMPFVLPPSLPLDRWDTLLDTADPWQVPRRLHAGDRYELQARSMAVLKLNPRISTHVRAVEWGPMGVY